MYFQEKECSAYWSKADFMPIHAILDYWCDKKPHDCREAKKQAILAACDNDEIEYTRNDDKPFKDSVYSLDTRGILLIKRESFDGWASQFSDEGSPLPPRENFRSEQTLLKIIGALLVANYQNKRPYMQGGKINAAQVYGHLSQSLTNIKGLSDSTVRKKIPQAMQAISENLSPW